MTDRDEGDRATPPIRVLLADDHRLFREGVASLLERAADLALVGEAATGAEAVALAERLMVDVVLMDLKMPGMGGIEATREIIRTSPHIGVIIVTMFEDDESVFLALRAGARGYVLKDAGRGELLRVIRSVAHGEALFGAPIAQRALQHLASAPAVGAAPRHGLVGQLTARELEVLNLIAHGRRNPEIANQLSISEKTVGNHISNIFAKLQVADRVQAVLRAQEAGLGQQVEDGGPQRS